MTLGMRKTHKSNLLLQLYRNRQLYWYLLIPMIWLLIFKYIPMYYVQIAFKKYSIAKGVYNSPWVGFQNFQKFFNAPQFKQIMTNTIYLSLYGFFASFPLPVLLALSMNAMRNQGYKKVIQTVTYMPHFISTVVLVGMLMQFFNCRIGLYGTVYMKLLGHKAPDLLGRASMFRHLYVWSGIWQNMGWSSIIYLSALAAVSNELHEAAMLDGATRFQRCLYVDFPAILPIITITLIMSIGGILGVGFEKTFLMQNPLNLSASEVISTYVYKTSIENSNDFSYGTAIDMFNSVVNLILLIIANGISRHVSETSLW